MKLKTLQIKNFKGFRDSGEVKFGAGFNVIVGQNNSGKTALIEALKLGGAGNVPFKEKGKKEDFELIPQSIFISTQHITKGDFVRSALKSGNVYIENNPDADNLTQRMNNFDGGDFLVEQHNNNSLWVVHQSPFGPMKPTSNSWVQLNYNRETQSFSRIGNQNGGIILHSGIYNSISSDAVYILNSQRFSIGRCSVSDAHALTSNAQNLPSALNNLQGSHPQKFQKIVHNLMEVFPSVGNLTVTPVSGTTEVEVIVWPYEDCDNIKEATALDKCGTGIAQALAILFIAALEDEKIIVIDEINSFLHPMAVKNLIRIVKQQYARHQYIISTHHTDVIAWSDPEEIILLQKSNGECKARNISLKALNDFELMTGELGISMADVFGSDQVIWVEGETEEQCFPLLIEYIGKKLPKGTNFSKIIGTGNLSLKNRNVDMAFDIYDKISRMASPLTRACVFTMDRETMSDADLVHLKGKAGNRLLVLNRRCYENYLILPEIVSDLLSKLEPGHTVEAVLSWLIAKGGEKKYGAQREWNGEIANAAWLVKVDGANLLSDMFGELTEQRYTYQKTTHSPQLSLLALQSQPHSLAELLEFAGAIVEKLKLS